MALSKMKVFSPDLILSITQGGTSTSGGWGGGGGLGLTSSLEAEFGTKSSQVHQLRGKTWEVLLPKVGKE